MKKILIFSHAMEIGGAEKALLGILDNLDYSRYAVDLFLMRHHGELMDYIPDGVNLLPEDPFFSNLSIPVRDVIRSRRFKIAYGRLKGLYLAKKRAKELNCLDDYYSILINYSHKYTSSYMPDIRGEYDLAISFLTPHYFVADKVFAKKKAAWIHTDYSTMKTDVESEIKMWEKYDRIISISDSAKDGFVKTFPALKDKVSTIENILPRKSIDSLADAFSASEEMPDDGSVKILSIGRFYEAKNFDSVPFICKKILDGGIKIKWYLIGFGIQEKLIRDSIARAGMQDHVVILGKKENPYPYLKACDIYCQPSRYEGKSVAVREAQYFHKPVVITNYKTSSSQLKNGFDGVVVPMDIDGCASGIIDVINNPSLREALIRNTSQSDYTYAEEISKIYNLLK